MTKDENPAGWVGGFAESDERFAYPARDLSSLDMLKNMDNIGLLKRQQAILWPEFSWNTKPSASDPKRCFQMFAPDISRVGYTNQGRVYSIICPQQEASHLHSGVSTSKSPSPATRGSMRTHERWPATCRWRQESGLGTAIKKTPRSSCFGK